MLLKVCYFGMIQIRISDPWDRGGSRIFFRRGALVSCSTSTPINHIVLFCFVFFCRIPVVLENRRSSRGGGGGGGPPRPPPPPLHPPPRSAPAWDHSDNGRSNEPMNHFQSGFTNRFIWSNMIQVISDHWFWSWSSQRNAPLVLHVEKKKAYIVPSTIVSSEYRSIMVSTEAISSKSTISCHKASACTICKMWVRLPSLTLARTRSHTPQCSTGGGGRIWNPSLEFSICCGISKRFHLQWKVLIFLTRWAIFYGWLVCWKSATSPNMVAVLGAILNFAQN